MLIKPKDIEIPAENPFENDLLGRKKEIENLSPILIEMESPLVLAIDSSWGTGKTIFVKLWRSHLEAQKISSVYFNAWESDYAEDPLVALVSALDKWVASQGNKKLLDGAWKKAKLLLPGIAKSSAVAAAKFATFGGLDIDKEYEKIAADLAGGITKDLVSSFDTQSAVIEKFKNIVSEVLAELGDEQKNLIVFVDELDRCRPTYAIELLERIKHLFNIEKLIFVLSTDINQLSHSVCAVYGSKFEARKYLQRFIDLDYSLKEPDSKNYIESLFGSLSFNEYFSQRKNGNYDREHLAECCELIVKRFDLTLREINLLLMRIRLILSSVPTNNYLDEPLIVCLLMLREHNPELYSKYVSDPGVADEAIEYLSRGLSEKDRCEFSFCLMVGYLLSPNNSGPAERFKELLAPYESICASQETNDREKVYAADRVIKVATGTRDFGRTMSHKTTVERIELLHRINTEL
uniref:KAP family P-loop NTPase fold protein n=1 Tax=Candidatus Electrothrix sp. TaxID=2170559 RepID=UPI004057C3D8